ncbi:altronate dehydratase [Humisphaera borealis]|uniref:Altronate dehydratase n=2 Tax=Humisphaera borealis TaxID=2807512 RepID=A0A7M2X673_9BACT|nr:altronate dehydratase [Humisphaera borealis]
MPDFLRIHLRDNVAVALSELPQGSAVLGIVTNAVIPRGHKVALKDLAAGEHVIKYGHPIGRAMRHIAAGELVHSHNLTSDLAGSVGNADFSAPITSAINNPPATPRTFDGFRRHDGGVGIRNEVWIINTVACVNRASEQIARAANARYCSYKTCDGVFSFTHPFGCAQLGDDLLYTQKVLAGLIRHPNAAAVLILGLGCENNQMKLLLEQVGSVNADRVKYFNAQDVADEIESGLDIAANLVEWACQFKREPIDARELIVGLKCGGSDGLSGITANPLVGRVADRHCARGGTALLTEVPEMFGAEQVLLERCSSRRTIDDTLTMVNGFRDYFRRYNQPIDENPSPGNKDGGITTLAEKSLGCVQKAGSSPIVDVLPYGMPAKPGRRGVALVNAPGNDGVSSTAMTVAGAHLLLFTTGRGTPLGMPVPTIKVSSNTALRDRKPSWIDFDAGAMLADGASADDLAEQLYDLCLDVASGKREARNEISGNREIAIWKDGVTL